MSCLAVTEEIQGLVLQPPRKYSRPQRPDTARCLDNDVMPAVLRELPPSAVRLRCRTIVGRCRVDCGAGDAGGCSSYGIAAHLNAEELGEGVADRESGTSGERNNDRITSRCVAPSASTVLDRSCAARITIFSGLSARSEQSDLDWRGRPRFFPFQAKRSTHL